MQQPEPTAFFGKEHAPEYDKRNAQLAPLHQALHWLTAAVFASLPAEARILCVGAGTGAELMYLAKKFPQWRFTAVEPSAPMLDICRQKVEAAGIGARCDFHEGFLDSLPAAGPFDAATALLVSQFILAPEARIGFFRGIADRLRPGGCLVSADLAADTTSAAYQNLLGVWLQLMTEAGISAERLAAMRAAYGRDVAVLPTEQVSALMAAGGFDAPVRFFQAGLVHAWSARRA